MSEWQTVKLETIADVIDSLHQTPKYSEHGLPMVRVTDIKRGYLDLSNTLKVDEDVFDKFSKNHKPNIGDIVISRVGSYGNTSIVKTYEKFCLGQNTAFIIPKQNALFLFYFLNSPSGLNEIESSVAGSTQPTVSLKSIRNIEILLPTLPEQKAIAAVLSSLDDKIDLLHRQNQTLEAMAETLFRQWFVVEAQEDWETRPLGDFVTVKRGGSPRPIQDYLSETGLRWLKISDATKTASPFIFEIKEHIKEEGLNKTTLLKEGSLVLSNSATPGIPKILQLDSCIHDGWLHFPKSYFSNEFLYLLFKKIRPELLNQGNGSIFTNLKTDILKEYPIPIADSASLKFFDDQVKPIFKKLLKNATQIQTLETLRDTLLPKLMSGEVRVDYASG